MTQRSMERCFILLCAKSSIRENKWNYRELVACLSGVFGEVASSRAQFNNHVRSPPQSRKYGSKLFWPETRVGDRPLAVSFLHLYRCVMRPHVIVTEYLERLRRKSTFESNIPKNLLDEVRQFQSLDELVFQKYIQISGVDKSIDG